MKRLARLLQRRIDAAMRWRVRHHVRSEIVVVQRETGRELEMIRMELRSEILRLDEEVARLKAALRTIRNEESCHQ